jgi:hypothetical protein
MQTTSEDKGIPFLEAHEGVVLTAYRCPAGKWTIGAGLTAASGVVAPHAGMTITRAEARRLLKLALARNYEPGVRQVLGPVPQHAFDGAVSFISIPAPSGERRGSIRTRQAMRPASGRGWRCGTRAAGGCFPACSAGGAKRQMPSCSTGGRMTCASRQGLPQPICNSPRS